VTPLGGDLLQLAFDGASAPKEPPVYRFEILARGIENEPARNAHGDADGTAIEFDRKSLYLHEIYSWPARTAFATSAAFGMCDRIEAVRGSLE
jgi:hypothetical protein